MALITRSARLWTERVMADGVASPTVLGTSMLVGCHSICLFGYPFSVGSKVPSWTARWYSRGRFVPLAAFSFFFQTLPTHARPLRASFHPTPSVSTSLHRICGHTSGPGLLFSAAADGRPGVGDHRGVKQFCPPSRIQRLASRIHACCLIQDSCSAVLISRELRFEFSSREARECNVVSSLRVKGRGGSMAAMRWPPFPQEGGCLHLKCFTASFSFLSLHSGRRARIISYIIYLSHGVATRRALCRLGRSLIPDRQLSASLYEIPSSELLWRPRVAG